MTKWTGAVAFAAVSLISVFAGCFNGLKGDDIYVVSDASPGADTSVLDSGAGDAAPDPGPCFPLPTGVVSWWRGENDSVDSVGPNSGEAYGTTNYGPGKVGQAFYFPPSASAPGFVTASATNFPTGGGDRTIEAWVYLAARYDLYNVEGLFVGYGAWGTPGGTTLLLVEGSPSDAGPPLTFSQWGGGLRGGPLTENVWHHVAVVLSSGALTLYLDGSPTATALAASQLAMDTPEGGLAFIGGEPSPPDGTWEWLVGGVDEATVYARALSADEIHGIFAAGSWGKCH